MSYMHTGFLCCNFNFVPNIVCSICGSVLANTFFVSTKTLQAAQKKLQTPEMRIVLSLLAEVCSRLLGQWATVWAQLSRALSHR